MDGRLGRIRAFDWLRGMAILVMIQCHALVLLRPELHAGRLFRGLDYLDGMVAPAFILASGFSLALVQVRSALAGARGPRLLKTLRRIGEVLGVATLVNAMWFPIFHQPEWILRVDILHCIGLSLLIALPLLAGLAARPKLLRWVCLGCALAVFAVSPFAESVRGPIARLANNSYDTLFPILPWAGYVYLGASAGAVAASGDLRGLFRWMLGLWLLSAVTWQAAPVFLKLYPPHVFWKTDPANHGYRLSLLIPAILVLLWLEVKVGRRFSQAAAVRWIEVFGTSSLSAYFFHEALLSYQVLGFSFESWWGARCGWGEYALLTAALICATFALTRATDRFYRWVSGALDHRMSYQVRPTRP